MKVLGDASAFALQGLLLFEMLKLAFVFALFDEPSHAGDNCDQADDHEREDPPRLPELAHQDETQVCLGGVPNAVAVAGGDLKSIIAGRNVSVRHRSPGAGVDPLRVQAFETVAETNALRRSETEAGVAEFETV